MDSFDSRPRKGRQRGNKRGKFVRIGTQTYTYTRPAQAASSRADGEGAPVKINMGNLNRPRRGEFRNGGLLPKSVIATGALHSETNQHAGHATAGKRGIPVLDAAGNKLAEVERDEWTLSDNATKTLHSLRRGGSLLALGKHVRQELLTNTTPSPRYAKRLS